MQTVTFRAGHSLTATCITLLQTHVSVWTYRHYLRQILLRWNHLRLYMYIFFYDLHASRDACGFSISSERQSEPSCMLRRCLT